MRSLAVLCCALALSACDLGLDSALRPPPPPPNQPPGIESIDVPSWPPLGPNASVNVSARDDRSLASISAVFARSAFRSVSGTSASASFSAAELGEGQGSLLVTATDSQGLRGEANVFELLIDLTPPEVEIGPLVVKADGTGPSGAIKVWGADAWVLGSIHVQQGQRASDTRLPQRYPATLGRAWDRSELVVSGAELAPGPGALDVRVSDAAGNFVARTVSILVDAGPPELQVRSPAPNQRVHGTFEVQFAAQDPEGEPTRVELQIGGARVATGAGPAATIALDAGTLAPGETELVALAFDRVGNASAPVRVPLVIE